MQERLSGLIEETNVALVNFDAERLEMLAIEANLCLEEVRVSGFVIAIPGATAGNTLPLLRKRHSSLGNLLSSTLRNLMVLERVCVTRSETKWER